MGRLNQKRLNEENNFLAVSMDWAKIAEKILSNEKLLKLIYHNQQDALGRNTLTEEEKQSLVNKNILSYPYIPTDDDVNNYIQILFDNFVPNDSNPQYVDNMVIISIFCHRENWILENWQLRLYMIANEIMNLLNGKKLTGIGKAQFVGGVSIVPSKDIIGLTLNFMVINSSNTNESYS